MSEGMVLGHIPRSHVAKPTERITMPSMEDLLLQDDEEDDGTGGNSNAKRAFPYATRLWGMRHAVQKACTALYTVRE